MNGLAVLVAALPLLTWDGQTMGTSYSVKIAGVTPTPQRRADLRAVVEQRLDEINRQMSHYLPDSELSRFNHSAATAPVKVPPEFARVTRRALELSRESGGAFDPTLGPLINLWGFGPEKSSGNVPAADDIAAAQRRCGARHLRVTATDELQKDIPGLQLNLGAIAKGFGADETARVLRERGYTNIFVSVSGEIVAFGTNAEGRPWQVGIERPRYGHRRNAELSAVVALSGRALSTSGDTHNYFRDATNRVRAHILDPQTGCPVEHNVASVTVIAPDGLTADGMATTLYVLGLERGLRWIEDRPFAAALFIVRAEDNQLRLVPSRRFPLNEMKGAEHHANQNQHVHAP
jgi:thiamine biosynthesis lipoprotein